MCGTRSRELYAMSCNVSAYNADYKDVFGQYDTPQFWTITHNYMKITYNPHGNVMIHPGWYTNENIFYLHENRLFRNYH